MRYRPPKPEELDSFERFLLRDAGEVFGPEADDGRVIDDLTSVYDRYPRYGRPRDIYGQGLVLGDRFFRLGAMANTVLAATHLGHDRYGILGPAVALESIRLHDIEMSDLQLTDFLEQLAAVVHRIEPTLVVEVDWLEMLDHGPAVASTNRQPPVHSVPSGHTGVIMVRDFGLMSVALVRTSDGLALEVEGERTPVSDVEGTVFVNSSVERLVAWVLGPNVDREARLGELLTRGLREDLEYVFMDQSSFRNALQAPEDEWLTPARLFDLSTLAHHLVFADAIAVPSSCEVPPSLEGVVVATDSDEVRISFAMSSLANANGFRPSDTLEADGLNQVEAAWRTFLGADVSLDYSLVDRATNSPGSWEYVPGGADASPDPAELLVAGLRGNRHSTRDVSTAASIHTLRYIVNQRRAQLMGLPYAASALRYPVQAVMVRNALYFRSVVDHLFRPGGPPEPHGEIGSLVHHLRLPDALGTACATARDTSEILPQVLELREAMTGFREAIRESRELGYSDTDTVRRLRKPLSGLTVARSVDTTVARLTSLATATGADLGTALVVAKLAKPLNLAERASKLLDVIRRPHVRVLQRFSQLVSDAATTEDLFRLWDMKPSREWFSVAVQLSDLSAFESAKMTRF